MKQRVVFVDDDVNVLNGFRRMLYEQVDDWDMVFLDCAEKALSEANAKQIDVIVSDLRMPDTDGFELLNQLKNLGQMKAIPVLIVTGNADEKLRRRALALGAEDLLGKPIEADDLIAHIRRALNPKSRRDGATNPGIDAEKDSATTSAVCE